MNPAGSALRLQAFQRHAGKRSGFGVLRVPPSDELRLDHDLAEETAMNIDWPEFIALGGIILIGMWAARRFARRSG